MNEYCDIAQTMMVIHYYNSMCVSLGLVTFVALVTALIIMV